MRILIISDTHGELGVLTDIVRGLTAQPDMVFHLGDVQGDEDYIERMFPCPVWIVRGNNDGWFRTTELPYEALPEAAGHRFFLAHGHRHGVHSGIDGLAKAAKEKGAEVVCFGHTHRPYIEEKYGMLFLNPGSLSYPRQEGHRPSYIWLTIDARGELHPEVRYHSAY